MATRGWENATASDVRDRRVEAAVAKAKRSKYGAVKTTVDGIVFHSAKEARRYTELKLLQQAGRIRNLRLQRRYVLCALVVDRADCRDVNAGAIANRRVPIGHYIGDFEYEESYLGQVWNLIVEDSKGMRTAMYKLKKRLFEAQYGVQIRET